MTWLFLIVLTFSGEAPVFGPRVLVEIRAESQTACERLRKVIAKEIEGYGMRARVSECRETIAFRLPE